MDNKRVKSEYQQARLTVIQLSAEDLIQTSNEDEYVNPGEWT